MNFVMYKLERDEKGEFSMHYVDARFTFIFRNCYRDNQFTIKLPPFVRDYFKGYIKSRPKTSIPFAAILQFTNHDKVPRPRVITPTAINYDTIY